jgi:lipoprotein-anchoring transpeptidase ErfK/SrfK
VGRDGSLGYASLALAEEGIPDAELEPGFAVALVRIERERRRDPFGLSSKGYWLPLRDLAAARPSSFRGVPVADGKLGVAWVVTDGAATYAAPGAARRSQTLARLTALDVQDVVERAGRRWVSIARDTWVDARDVAMPTATEPPSAVQAGERWIDVDLASQTLVAYTGTTVTFATLVSTGKGRAGSEQATPRGTFRIWVKLATSDMDNLEDADASRYYAMQEVPWVMFFERGYGLHGTYWHDDFGRVRSHGCVNLSPADAAWLFHFSGPRLPAGWTAALPTPYDRGTLVQVH